MNIREKFALYKQLYSEILDEFGMDGWEQIDNKLEAKWRHNEKHNDMLFYEGDCEYGIDDARLIKEVDGLVLFYCRDNGDKFYSLFDTANKLGEEDEDE
jgi:hypothetical protein